MKVLLEHKGKSVEITDIRLLETGDTEVTYGYTSKCRECGQGFYLMFPCPSCDDTGLAMYKFQAKGRGLTELFSRITKQLDNLK
jgi:hypothetical protein